LLYLSIIILSLLYLFWTLDWFLLYLSIIILSLLYLFWILDWFCCIFPSSFCLYCISSGLWTDFCCTFPSAFCLYCTVSLLDLDWFLLYLSIIILSSAVSLLDFGLVFAVPLHHPSVLFYISSALWTGFCCTFTSSSCPLLYLFCKFDWFLLYLSIIILSFSVSLLEFGLVFDVPFHHHSVLYLF